MNNKNEIKTQTNKREHNKKRNKKRKKEKELMHTQCMIHQVKIELSSIIGPLPRQGLGGNYSPLRSLVFRTPPTSVLF